MIYRRTEAAQGSYVDADGARWNVECCRRIRTREGVDAGWTEFATAEAALTEWGLEYDPLPTGEAGGADAETLAQE